MSRWISDLVGQSSLCVPVYELVCVSDHVKAITHKLLCERLSVWDMCGRVCGWATFLSIKVTSGPPSASGGKWSMPNAFSLLLLFSRYHFLLIHPERPWVGQTHLASHHRATFPMLTRKLTHTDACIPCMLIQLLWSGFSKTEHTRFSFSQMWSCLLHNRTHGARHSRTRNVPIP